MQHSALALHRLFFAILPPPQTARQIDQESIRLGGDAKRVATDRLHVTLDILNDYPALPAGLVDRMRAAGASVAAARFRMTLDRVRGSNSSVALRPEHRIAALMLLQKRIDGALRRAGLTPRENFRFSPHMTLFYRTAPPFSATIRGFAWAVEDFVLIRSHVGRTRYDILDRWRLCGDAPDQYELF